MRRKRTGRAVLGALATGLAPTFGLPGAGAAQASTAFHRRQVNRSHALVRSAADSPVRYNAFDPRLQLWVAACLYRGGLDVYTRPRGPVDEATADAIYRECRRLGTTLQVPEHMWPTDRAAFDQYWASAMAELRIDPPVRDAPSPVRRFAAVSGALESCRDRQR